MLTHITRGRALVTVTELTGPRWAVIGLGVLAAAAIGTATAYARTIREVLTISVTVLFALTLAAVIAAVAMLARRVLRELGGAAPAVDNDRLRAVERGQLDRAAVDVEPGALAVEPGPAWPYSPALAVEPGPASDPALRGRP